MKQPTQRQILFLAGAATLMVAAGAIAISQWFAAHRAAHRTMTNSVAVLSARGFTFQQAPRRFQIPLLRNNTGPIVNADAPGPGTTDHDLKTLAELHDVKQLSLSRTSITDEGLRHLTALSELEHLNLDHTKISDDGLAQLTQLSSLRSISLRGTMVSDNGLKYLAAMPNLESAQLSRDKVTDTGIEAFRPLCKRFIKIHRCRKCQQTSACTGMRLFAGLLQMKVASPHPVMQFVPPMALFNPGFTRCALCGEVLAGDDDMVGTTHFIGDRDHPLFAYSDALMHRACFLKWDRRDAFVASYNAEMGHVHRMRWDGTIRDRFIYWIGVAIIDKIAAVESWLRRRSG